MFEQAFKNIDDVLWKEAGCTTELDYTAPCSSACRARWRSPCRRTPISTRASISSTCPARTSYSRSSWNGSERAARAKVAIDARFNTKQQVFLGFVLSQYIKVGVEELDREKLSPLLKLKYHDAIADAVADLGRPEEIGHMFAGFQKYLYRPEA
jgi:hypothetical protein